MKTYLLSTLLLLLCFRGFSQNYQPFLEGKLHYFTSGSNYSIRVDSSDVVGADSAFWMNEIALFPEPGCTTVSFPNNYHTPLFDPGHEGFFADHFIRRIDGAYQFVTREGDTATFQTRLPNGVTWDFLSDSTLSASIASRGQINVAGTLDSVIVIDISDGHQYQLTQHHGLYSGLNLSYYLHGDIQRAALLARLPLTPNWRDFLSWQVGDVYGSWFHINSGNGYEHYDLREVLARYDSPNQDTIGFTYLTKEVEVWFPTGGTYIIPPFQESVEFHHAELGGLEKATYEVHYGPTNFHFQLPWTTNFNGRLQLQFYYNAADGTIDSCGFIPAIATPCTLSFVENWTHDLGLTSSNRPFSQTMTWCIDATYQLLCYGMIGQDSVGPCPSPFDLLSAESPFDVAEFTVFQNPVDGSQGILWKGIPAGRYSWQLYDLQGRLLWEKAEEMAMDGRKLLDPPGSDGIYVVRIMAESGDWGKSLKVPFLSGR
jgi:hypothetical protein